MPTQIIDNFDLTSQLPLDARLVVGPNAFFQTKDAIQNKYYGLRVWDFNEGLPYVWTGSAWENENSGSVLVSNGQGGFLSKFTGTGTSNTITKSIIYESVSGSVVKVGIGNVIPSETLDVNGNVKSTGSTGFIGNGGSINAINATNITTGFLGLNRLFTTGAAPNSILFYNGTSTIWRPQAQIRVASATGIEIVDENDDFNFYDVIFYRRANTVSDGQTSGPNSYRVSSSSTSSKLQFKPSSGQLRLSNGTALDPGFTFKGHPTGRAGMFLDFSNGDWWNGGVVITIEQNQGAPASNFTSKGERLRIIGGGFSGNWASNFYFHSNNYINKNLLLSVSDGGVTAAAPGKATFYSNSLSEVEWLNQGNFTIGSSTTINGSLTTTGLTVNGTTTITGVTNVYADFNVGATGNFKTTRLYGSLIVGGDASNQFQVSGMKALFTGSQISMGLSHDTTLQGGILPKLVVKSSFGDANDGKVALFTNGLWTNGKSSIVYIGDGNHYLSSTYGGSFLIHSIDDIEIHSNNVANPRSIKLKVNNNEKIIVNNTTTTLSGNVAMVNSSQEPGYPKNANILNGVVFNYGSVGYDRIAYIYPTNSSFQITSGSAYIRVQLNGQDILFRVVQGSNTGGGWDGSVRNQASWINFSFIIPAGVTSQFVCNTGDLSVNNNGVTTCVYRLGR